MADDTCMVAKFDRIHRTYARRGLSYATHLLDDEWLAEDALQNTFFIISQNLEKVDDDIEGSKCKGYFLAILKHECLGIIRARREGQTVSLETLEETYQQMPVSTDIVEEICEAHDTIDTISQRIKKLPELDRRLFIDRLWYNLDYNLLADKYNLTTSYARVKMSRIRSKILKGIVSFSTGDPLSAAMEVALLLRCLQVYLSSL